MKKIFSRMFLFLLLVVLIILILVPNQIFANGPAVTLDVLPGLPGTDTEVIIWVGNGSGSNYSLHIAKFDGSNYVAIGSPFTGTIPNNSWSESFDRKLSTGKYLAGLEVGTYDYVKYFEVTTCYYEDEVSSKETNWTYSNSCGSAIKQVYIWAEGNGWLMTSDGSSPSIGVSGIGTSTVTVNEAVLDVEKIRYYYNCCPEESVAEPV